MNNNIKEWMFGVLWIVAMLNIGFFLGDIWYYSHKAAINKTYIIEVQQGECYDFDTIEHKTMHPVFKW